MSLCMCVFQTIFEIHSTTKSVGKQVMKKKRYIKNYALLCYCSCDSHVIVLDNVYL